MIQKSLPLARTVLWGLLCLALSSWASYPQKPNGSHLYDDNHWLNGSEVRLFNDLASEFFEKTGTELYCVLLDNIDHHDPKDFVEETAKAWALGGSGGEGILIFVSPKQRWKTVKVTEKSQGIFSEETMVKLQQKTLLPAFREHNYSQGILAFAYALAQKGAESKKVTLNIDPIPYEIPENKVSSLMVLFIMFVFFLVLMAKFSGGRGNGCLWFLLGGAIKSKQDKTETGFAGNFGSTRNNLEGGFGGGFNGSFGSGLGRGYRGKL